MKARVARTRALSGRVDTLSLYYSVTTTSATKASRRFASSALTFRAFRCDNFARDKFDVDAISGRRCAEIAECKHHTIYTYAFAVYASILYVYTHCSNASRTTSSAHEHRAPSTSNFPNRV